MDSAAATIEASQKTVENCTRFLAGLDEPQLRSELEHSGRSVRTQQLAAGIATDYSRDNVRPGDLVHIRNQWRKVVRTSTNTVAGETGYRWTSKTP
jgi:hypothetical protein